MPGKTRAGPSSRKPNVPGKRNPAKGVCRAAVACAAIRTALSFFFVGYSSRSFLARSCNGVSARDMCQKAPTRPSGRSQVLFHLCKGNKVASGLMQKSKLSRSRFGHICINKTAPVDSSDAGVLRFRLLQFSETHLSSSLAAVRCQTFAGVGYLGTRRSSPRDTSPSRGLI